MKTITVTGHNRLLAFLNVCLIITTRSCPTLTLACTCWLVNRPFTKVKVTPLDQEVASPVQEVGSFGKDAVLGDPETQSRTKHQHH